MDLLFSFWSSLSSPSCHPAINRSSPKLTFFSLCLGILMSSTTVLDPLKMTGGSKISFPQSSRALLTSFQSVTFLWTYSHLGVALIPQTQTVKNKIHISLFSPTATNHKQNKPQNRNPPPDFPISLAEDALFLENHAGHYSQIWLFRFLSARFRGPCLANVSAVCPVSVLITIYTPELVLTGSYLE